MKQPKRLTLEQKKCLMAHNLNPKEWALIEETEFMYHIYNKKNGKKKRVDKFRR